MLPAPSILCRPDRLSYTFRNIMLISCMRAAACRARHRYPEAYRPGIDSASPQHAAVISGLVGLGYMCLTWQLTSGRERTTPHASHPMQHRSGSSDMAMLRRPCNAW